LHGKWIRYSLVERSSILFCTFKTWRTTLRETLCILRKKFFKDNWRKTPGCYWSTDFYPLHSGIKKTKEEHNKNEMSCSFLTFLILHGQSLKNNLIHSFKNELFKRTFMCSQDPAFIFFESQLFTDLVALQYFNLLIFC